jgi:hypothetical protein
MITGTFEVELAFGANGNSRSFTVDGWSRPEPQYTFNNGHEARLVLPKLFDSDRYELSIDVWPFVVRDRLPVQHIEIIVRGSPVMHAAADSRERRVMRCEIPPHVVDGCESVDITFRFPDAAAPAGVNDDSSDTRILAFAFLGVKFSGRLIGGEQTTHVATE